MNNPRPQVVSRFLLLALFLAIAIASHDQMESAAAGPIREEAGVGLVSVPVRVTDSHGRPVAGLTVDDFQLFEDGKKIAITDFAAIAATPENARQPPELQVVVVIDAQNIHPLHRNSAIESAGKFVQEDLAPDVATMVVSNSQPLQVLKSISESRDALPYKLDELKQGGAPAAFDVTGLSGQQDVIERAVVRIRDCARSSSCPMEVLETETRSVVSEIQAYTQGRVDQSLGSLERLEGFCRSLGTVPGEKSLLLISDGFELQPGRELIDDFSSRLRSTLQYFDQEVASENIDRDQVGVYEALQNVLRRSGIGSFSEKLSKKLEQTAAAANSSAVRIYAVRAAPPSSGSVGKSAREPLLDLAQATGGVLVEGSLNTERILGQMVRDSGTYYRLGYASAVWSDTSYHGIKVKLKKRKGRQARYPNGFRGKTTETRRADELLAALFHGRGDNPAEIVLKLSAREDQAGQAPSIDVRVEIPSTLR